MELSIEVLSKPIRSISRLFCANIVSLPDIAIPASDTTKSGSPSCASIKASVPPSECPIMPHDPLVKVRANDNAALASSLKVPIVAAAKSPFDSPVPRSSNRNVATPFRARKSDMTANGLCSNSSSSRFCGPLPVTKTQIGVLPLSKSDGNVNVPHRAVPSAE